VAKVLGIEMPTVYGYKTTDSKPVRQSECKGVHYYEWRKGLQKKASNPKVRYALKQWRLNSALETMSDYYLSRTGGWEPRITKLADKLGDDHPIVTALRDCIKAKEYVSQRMDPAIKNAIAELIELVPTPKVSLKDAYAAYPLIGLQYGDLKVLWQDENSPLWIDYIRMVDDLNKMTPA